MHGMAIPAPLRRPELQDLCAVPYLVATSTSGRARLPFFDRFERVRPKRFESQRACPSDVPIVTPNCCRRQTVTRVLPGVILLFRLHLGAAERPRTGACEPCAPVDFHRPSLRLHLWTVSRAIRFSCCSAPEISGCVPSRDPLLFRPCNPPSRMDSTPLRRQLVHRDVVKGFAGPHSIIAAPKRIVFVRQKSKPECDLATTPAADCHKVLTRNRRTA